MKRHRRTRTASRSDTFGGQNVGSLNDATKLLNEAILRAAELEGSDGAGKGKLVGFLRRVAKEDPRAFVKLLGTAFPLQAESSTDSVEVRYRTVEEVRRDLDERGITYDVLKRLLDPEQVE
jgi:hypothetical protein